jgi:transposase-like protein
MEVKCKRCRSTNTVKKGHRKAWRNGLSYRVQMYLCNHCGHQFDIGEIS